MIQSYLKSYFKTIGQYYIFGYLITSYIISWLFFSNLDLFNIIIMHLILAPFFFFALKPTFENYKRFTADIDDTINLGILFKIKNFNHRTQIVTLTEISTQATLKIKLSHLVFNRPFFTHSPFPYTHQIKAHTLGLLNYSLKLDPNTNQYQYLSPLRKKICEA